MSSDHQKPLLFPAKMMVFAVLGLGVTQNGQGGMLKPSFPHTSTPNAQVQGAFFSEKQFLFKAASTGYLGKGVFAGGSAGYGRLSQVPSDKGSGGTTPFYRGQLEGAYQASLATLTLDLNAGKAAQNKIGIYGGAIGVLLVNDPEEPSEAKIPRFQVGLKYSLQTLNNASNPTNDKNRTSFNVLQAFGHLPFADDWEAFAEFTNASYVNLDASFYPAVRGIFNLDRNFFGASTLGNLRQAYTAGMTWKLSMKDFFRPLYQFSKTDYAKPTAHTFFMEWSHFFSERIFMAPAYEISFQGDQKGSCFLLRISSFL